MADKFTFTDSKRQRLEGLRVQLETERSTWLPQYRELAEFIQPNRPRFAITDNNRGDRRNRSIIDGTGSFAARTLTSGLMSGLTSPARPWFRLTTGKEDMDELGAVKNWLYIVGERMGQEFTKSDLYNVLPSVYDDLGTFGTAAGSIEENFAPGAACVRFNSFPVGSYCLALDSSHRVAVFYREFPMTVRRLVETFGNLDESGKPLSWDNISLRTRELWEKGQLEEKVNVCHFIVPNTDYKPNMMAAKYKRYASDYYEKGEGNSGAMGANNDVYLRESGFDEFPVFGPRWSVTGDEVYATNCPGMMAMGDIKQLQLMQKRKLQAIEKMVNPPMVYPLSMSKVKTSILPGDSNYADERDGMKGIRPAHEVNINLGDLGIEIQNVQQRIKQAFFADLFLMMAEDQRNERPTATEVQERREEKLLVLGPVMQQLDMHLLRPIVNNAFAIMERRGMFPPAPKELVGVDIKVEFTSMMAQAQKLVSIGVLDRLVQTATQIAAVAPEVLDKVDLDQAMDVYSQILSGPPGIVRTDEQVATIRQNRAQAQQAQAQSEQMQAMGRTAKDLSGASLDGDNALTALIQQSKAGQLAPQP